MSVVQGHSCVWISFSAANLLVQVDTKTVKSPSHIILSGKSLLGTVLLAVLLMSAAIGSENARAQEEPPEDVALVIYDEVTGPYRVKIRQSPPRAIVGTLRVIVEPTYAETGEPVENALIRIFGTPPEAGERQFSPGLNSPTDRTRYFGQMELEEPGVWTIDVEIDADGDRAIAIAQATIHERARSGDNTLVGTILFILISGAFVGAGTWLWLTSKKARRRRDAIRESGGRPRRSSG